MSPEVALLMEVWAIVSTQIHAKERALTAETLLRAFDEHLDISDIEIFKNEFDRPMKIAIRSHFEDALDDDDEADDWE